MPYRGTAPALNDLLAGNVQMLIGGTTTMLPYIKNGKVRPLAITKQAHRRRSRHPDLRRAGLSDARFNLWHGMIGPKGIPGEIVQRMNRELDAVMKSPEVSGRLADDGVIAVGGTSDAFMATIRAEVKRWQDFIQRTGSSWISSGFSLPLLFGDCGFVGYRYHHELLQRKVVPNRSDGRDPELSSLDHRH